MINILDNIATILGGQGIYRGYQPPEPDACTTIYEYPSTPPLHMFGRTYITHTIQARTRAPREDPLAAYKAAVTIAGTLNRYKDSWISILQSSTIIDIGRDNKQRQEYTVNFTVRRLKGV